MTTRSVLTQIFTEDDGVSVCVAKVLAVGAVVAYVCYAGYGLLHSDHFALGEFGNGLMTVLLGGSGIIAGKQFTQQKDKP